MDTESESESGLPESLARARMVMQLLPACAQTDTKTSACSIELSSVELLLSGGSKMGPINLEGVIGGDGGGE